MKKSYFSKKKAREIFSGEPFLRLLLAGVAGLGISASADEPIGIIGGVNSDTSAYAAYVYSDGTLSPISNLPNSTNINSVAINGTGMGLIGGQDGGSGGAFAAITFPNGQSIPLTFPWSSSNISATALNSDGLGLIGDGGDMQATSLRTGRLLHSLSVPMSFKVLV